VAIDDAVHQRCDTCDQPYLPRPEGDMADLNNMCRRCAEELAYQLSVDYNLPEGCSDEERIAALSDGDKNEMYLTYSCITTSCIAYKKRWTTQLSWEEWQAKYGRPPHCFRCGLPSILERAWYWK
jgi:hypothetical protein